MSAVEYLVGGPELCRLPLPVYSEDAVAFAGALSQQLLRTPAAKALPDVTSFAFWCRKGNLQKLREACHRREERLGRGLVLHIAPANVPVNFAFSFLFSLLAGNANLVRVPSKPFPQVEVICRAVQAVLPGFPEIERRTAFVRYPAQEEATRDFSLMADARMIWGGDATVASLRQMPTKPRCLDVVFADRYSLCLLDCRAVKEAGEAELAQLAEGFYNDTYLMDQNACSSPQLVLWQGKDPEAQERFWRKVGELAAERYPLPAALAVDKYTQLCQDAVDRPEVCRVERGQGNVLYRAQLKALPQDAAGLRGKGGYFYEYSLDSLEELCSLVTEQYQTITCFGFPLKELREFVIFHRLRGVDRVVPVGKALDIGLVWDGYDLVGMLSRLVATE